MQSPEKAIFHTLSNLKFGDTIHKVGDFFEAEIAKYGYLAEQKILRIVNGAKTIEEAESIIAEEKKQQVDAEKQESAPVNTWGAKPDVVPAVENTESPKTGEQPKEAMIPVDENVAQPINEVADLNNGLGGNL